MLSRGWAFANVLHHVGARGEIELEYALTRPFHVEEHGLMKMPPKQLICDTIGIVWISTHRIQHSTVDIVEVAAQIRDLVPILTIDEQIIPGASLRNGKLTYIWVDGNAIAIK